MPVRQIISSIKIKFQIASVYLGNLSHFFLHVLGAKRSRHCILDEAANTEFVALFLLIPLLLFALLDDLKGRFAFLCEVPITFCTSRQQGRLMSVPEEDRCIQVEIQCQDRLKNMSITDHGVLDKNSFGMPSYHLFVLPGRVAHSLR